MPRIGYARVSTEEQNLALQLDALGRAGCHRVLCDEGLSAADPKRAGFAAALELLEPGDTLVVWRFDRAFRSSIHAIEVLDALRGRNVQFQSITEQIDTGTPHGRFQYQLIASLAELERNIISLRTKEGMKAAKRRGVKVGRPRKIPKRRAQELKHYLLSGEKTVNELAKELNVHPSTVYRLTRSTTRQWGQQDGKHRKAASIHRQP